MEAEKESFETICSEKNFLIKGKIWYMIWSFAFEIITATISREYDYSKIDDIASSEYKTKFIVNIIKNKYFHILKSNK